MFDQVTPMVQSAPPPLRLGQSVWAVLAGFLNVVLLSVGTDIVLHQLKTFPRVKKSSSLLTLRSLKRRKMSVR